MPDSAAPAPVPSDLPTGALPADLLLDLLAISLTGVNLLRPLYGPDGGPEPVDFTVEYLNPAAQRMTGLPERPGGTMRSRFPDTFRNGVFAFYQRVYQTGEAGRYNLNYQADGFDNYFHVAARRSGELLVVSFTDTADQTRTPVELALRESQAAEQAARAEAEAQRQRFYDVLMQLPAHVALHEGPDQTFTLVNPDYQRIANGRNLLGQPIREAWPELVSHGILDVLAQVYQTGEPYTAAEVPVQADFTRTGQLEQVYYNFFFLPLRATQGQVTGVLNFSYDVTASVRARQQVEQLNQELEARVAERTQALQAARTQTERQRRQFEELFMRAPAAICIFNGPDWVYEFVNPGYQAMFPGRPLLGLPLLEALPEVAGQPLLDILHRVYDTGETFEGKDVLVPLARTPDGPIEDIYFDLTYQARFDDAGRIDGFVTYAYDVTEQVLARQERETQRQQLNDLFMQAPAAICILAGPDLVYELVNPGYQQLFPRRPLLGRPLLDALPEIAGNAVYKGFRQVYEQGVTLEAKALLIPLARPDDGVLEDRYFNYIQQPRRDAHGRVDGVLVFAFEVTEQVRARQASEADAQRLKLLTDALPVLIGYLDQDRRYRFANEAYRAWFQQDPDALLGRPVREVVGEKAYAATQAYMERALAGERVDFDAQMPYREGFTKHILTNYIPDVQAGRVAGFYTLVSDVSDQVQAREQVQDLNRELASINQELAAINEEMLATNEELSDANHQLTRVNVDLDNFIYTASHDLKAPISNLEGLLYLLREELPAEVAQGKYVAPTLTRMLDAVERFKRTIDHLTEVSKLQKEHATALAAIDLAAVVEDVRQDLVPLIQSLNATLVVAVTDFPPILFTEKNLRSVVYNLLSNALKYHSPDRRPHVDVRAHVQPGFTVLEVHDNGLGLDARHLPQLFTMFQRFHDHVEGTGIGLYMVKRMVDNAGGRIEVHSQLGAGTTFFVHLPHAPRPTP